MYLRHTTRRKDGKTHTYWRLVRSVRTGNRVRQETVACLGSCALAPIVVKDKVYGRQTTASVRRLIGGPIEPVGMADRRGARRKKAED